MSLANFGKRLAEWHDLAAEWSPLQLMDRILNDIDYQTYLDDGSEEGRDRWDNVQELRRLAAEFQGQGLAAFLEQIALVSDQDTIDAGASVPTMLTLHAAKGLEFPIVFIVGLNDGVLPHSRSFEDPEAMQEERRLLYVGITRAKDRLYLLYSQNRSLFGFSEPATPSRYLDDIPGHLLDGNEPVPVRKLSPSANYHWEKSSKPASVLQPQFTPGMRVFHPVWQDGMVLNSRIQDGDEVVDVFFDQVGLKRLLASLAKLEIKP